MLYTVTIVEVYIYQEPPPNSQEERMRQEAEFIVRAVPVICKCSLDLALGCKYVAHFLTPPPCAGHDSF